VSYRTEIAPAAQREVKDLPGHVRAQARELIRELANNPRSHRARELRDKPGLYRVWLAGHWRIAYQIDDDLQRIRILRVRRKEQIDYQSLESPE
jgi:mRNA-degrading endonuclease RelE of RelBE toxin-antitoxin system